MKRIIVVLVLALAIAGLAAAEGINLGSFPLGTWLDANYSAIWEFSTGNIRILSPSERSITTSTRRPSRTSRWASRMARPR